MRAQPLLNVPYAIGRGQREVFLEYWRSLVSIACPPSLHPVCLLSCEPVGIDKQALGCTGEGLKPEGLSPRLCARLLAVPYSLVSLLEQTSKHRAAQVRG